MSQQSRRDFLKFTLAAGAALPAVAATKRAATDMVPLGKSGVKVTRLAFGTGTHGGRVQRELGQEQFTRLVRHAYDRGIRFFETADTYNGMPQMLGIALKGIPRDSYRLMTKYKLIEGRDTAAAFDQYRRDMNSEYFDIVLIHCVRSPNWVEESKREQDAFSEAKHKKIILAHGASVHGLQPLRAFPGNQWLDVALLRVNHNGTRMDSMSLVESPQTGNVEEVTAQSKKIHAQGTGVLGMKLIGEGRFTSADDREAAMRYAMGLGSFDAVTIGYKNTGEVDEAIDRMNRALNS